MREDHYKVENQDERTLSPQACLKEAGWHLADIRKAKKKFESMVLAARQDKRLETKEPEKVLQYIKDKSKGRNKVAQMEKVNLKNQTLQAHKLKLQQQLQQKKETGKAECEDFYQEYHEQQIDKRSEELTAKNSKALCLLGSHKGSRSVTAEAAQLGDHIASRKQLLVKIEEKLQRAEEVRHFKPNAVIQKHDFTLLSRRLIFCYHQLALESESKARSTQRTSLTPAGRAGAGNRTGEQHVSLKLPHVAENKSARTREPESLLGS
ncbi:LOW QUALITY PROTEIN: cilia- and flagella-associated protein 263 [Spinachia spinachia]